MKKYLLYIGLPLLFIIIFPFLLPSEFQVERSIKIMHSKEDVFAYLVNLESWSEWSPWLEKEPSAEYEFSGIPGVVGSYSQWKGQEIGSGKQTLVKIEEPNYIETLLEFKEPQESMSTGYMKLNDIEGGVEIIWGLKGQLSGPIDRIFGLLIPSMVSKDFDKGLLNLKNKLSQK